MKNKSNKEHWWAGDGFQYEITATYTCTCEDFKKENNCIHVEDILHPDYIPEGCV